MRKKNTLWRYLFKLHRYAGLLSAIILIMLAVTGIALNHTDDLKLDSQMVQSPALLDWYGIKAPANFISFPTTQHWVSQVDKQIYFDSTQITQAKSKLKGAVETEDFIVLAFKNQLLLLSLQGEIIESIPFKLIENIATYQQAVVIKSSTGIQFSIDGLLSWNAFKDTNINWSTSDKLPAPLATLVKTQFRSSIIPLERVVLDIHSGRFFGKAGVIVVDISGVLLILLAGSGCSIWLRHKLKSLRRQ